MQLFHSFSASVRVHFMAVLFTMTIGFSLTAQTGCLDDEGNLYEPYAVLVVSDDPCENFTCAQTALGFAWVINEEFLDDCAGNDEDDDDGEDGGEEDDLEGIIEWLEELCGSDVPNDLGIDSDLACGILELIEACDNGSEEACVEFEMLWEEFGDLLDNGEEDDDEEDGDDNGEDDDEDDDEEDDEENGDDDGEDGDKEDDLEGMIEWLEELCGSSDAPNDLGIDADLACGILELIEACENGSEEACVELEMLWEQFEDLLDNGEDDDAEEGDNDEEDEDGDDGEDDDEENGDDGEDDDEEDGDDGEDDEEDGDDEDDEEENGGGEECLVEFEFEQAMSDDGVPMPYNVIAYVDEPEADTYYFWTFGDGMESDEPNPTHVYDDLGNYEVCLTVTQVTGNLFSCTAVHCDTLMIDMDGLVRQQLTLNVLFPGQTINAVAEQQTTMAVLPNPAGDHFRIQAEGIESAVVRTMDGRWVGRWAAGGLDTMEISSSGWPSGAYVIEARTANGILRSRVLVQH